MAAAGGAGVGDEGAARSFMALPGRTGDAREVFRGSSALPPRTPLVRAAAQVPEEGGPDVSAEWYATALREFVGNEDLDVRRCLLPGLPLWKSFHPPELHGLVETAVTPARSHPDPYLRHRVEHPVGGG
ncbi:hypothetical protein [Streptomyces sp. NPDC048002]|uniref:hypothetical protein n=1 Tax=Streptomyces sp. NPDC048002 TaxID=3154344 RepID=UPI00340F636A